ELGILHYFVDLRPLARVVRQLLRPGGRLILQDFHPVSTKLITSTGKKHKVTGNYFDTGLQETDVAYTKYLPEERRAELKKVRHRHWTLGEIVTAIAAAGLFVRSLDEEPNTKADDAGIPKTFTLVAERLG
ncbi:MAG: SAM-dependent methyltransferase, partial [Firmicutes bacterium]|nr:SAM-dependent methyltransferase [Bacillota bacterium]